MIERLRVVFLNGTNCSVEFQKLYTAAYSHWKEMWKATFLELDDSSSLTSDNFTRQDEIMALFLDDECIAMVCNRFVDLNLESHFDDTYFLTWPRATLERLKQPGLRVAIGNQISIDPRFRKLPDDIALKDVLMWLYHKRQAEGVDLTLGAVREDKALDKLFVKFGAEILAPNIIQHHVPVALIAIWRDKIQLDNHDLPINLLNSIYSNKTEDTKYLPKGKTMSTLKKLMSIHENEMKRTANLMESCPWEQKDFYVNWCAQFFFFVAHATRLLAASATRLQLDRDKLHLYFLDHCQEEKNHEKLFEKDLKSFGSKPQDFEEHPLAASLYQSQYYLINYQDPAALFGSILFLEGMSISAGPEVYRRLKTQYGDNACNFVKVHVHDDIDHIDKANKILEKMSEKELQAITVSYKQSCFAFNSLLKELKAKYEKVRHIKAA